MNQRFNFLLLFVMIWGAPTVMAQTQFFNVRIDNVGQAFTHQASGIFNTPVGATAPGPIFPGDAYEFTFYGAPGSSLSLATMFVQSNDLFYAPGANGIALFDGDGTPISGDITDQLGLWDAGTEVNEAPGVGINQAPRQSGPNVGADENGVVQLVNDGFTYPVNEAVIRATITPADGGRFTVRLENVSTAGTITTGNGDMVAVPLSPGAWVVHTSPEPLFTPGAADRGLGLEGIAEDGDAAPLGASLAAKVGYGSGVFNTPVGAVGPGPIFPGDAYEFTFYGAPGSSLSLATMFVQSNDLFYAPGANGIALFDGDGNPISGDITDQLGLWDAGTEVNEAPGVGINQAPRQSGPNVGADENGVVQLVNDGFTYPSANEVIRVTINLTQTANESEVQTLPDGFALHQNYPNPFNPTTRIAFELATGGDVSLEIYNVLGQRVRTLLGGFRNAGTYEVNWDARDQAGLPVATGLYLYRLQVDARSQTRQMVLLR